MRAQRPKWEPAEYARVEDASVAAELRRTAALSIHPEGEAGGRGADRERERERERERLHKEPNPPST